MHGLYKNRRSEHANEINVPWRTVCGWAKHITLDRSVAREKAVARKKRKDFPDGKSAIRLRLFVRVVDLIDDLVSR